MPKLKNEIEEGRGYSEIKYNTWNIKENENMESHGKYKFSEHIQDKTEVIKSIILNMKSLHQLVL